MNHRIRITPSVVPNLFTAMNMFSGFLSIVNASQGEFSRAAWFIITGAVFDALDGLVARLTKSSSELGVELDSLSDIVSFGAAPSFLIYSAYLYQFETVGIILSSLLMIAEGRRRPDRQPVPRRFQQTGARCGGWPGGRCGDHEPVHRRGHPRRETTDSS